MKKFAVDVYIKGMNGERALSKFKRGDIPVLRAEKMAKNLVAVRIYRKDLQKAIAIFKGSCYNIIKVNPAGLYAAAVKIKRRACFFIAAALFAASVFLTDGLILKISYSGSGAYYKTEAAEILSGFGIRELRFLSSSDVPMATSAILSLPSVTFCSVKVEGYILKVKIEVNEESSGAEKGGLYSDRAGVIREITVLNGTALVSEGDGVLSGELIVAPYNLKEDGAKTDCLVSARVVIECTALAEGETEEIAKKRAEFLSDGEIISLSAFFDSEKYTATAVYRKVLSVNF